MSDFPSTLERFDPVDWKLIARNRLRKHCKDFPFEGIEIVRGFMGKDRAPPEEALELCQIDSMDSGIAEVTERFLISAEGVRPWKYSLWSVSEYDSGRLVAQVTWARLDPLEAGLRMWQAYLLWRGHTLIAPYAARAGAYLRKEEVSAIFAEMLSDWAWQDHPRKDPVRLAPLGTAWLPLLEQAAGLEDARRYPEPLKVDMLPPGAAVVGSIREPQDPDLSAYYVARREGKLALFRQYLTRRLRGSYGYKETCGKELWEVAGMPFSEGQDLFHAGALLFLKCRSAGRVRSFNLKPTLQVSALNWILEDESAMALCKSLPGH